MENGEEGGLIRSFSANIFPFRAKSRERRYSVHVGEKVAHT